MNNFPIILSEEEEQKFFELFVLPHTSLDLLKSYYNNYHISTCTIADYILNSNCIKLQLNNFNSEFKSILNTNSYKISFSIVKGYKRKKKYTNTYFYKTNQLVTGFIVLKETKSIRVLDSFYISCSSENNYDTVRRFLSDSIEFLLKN